MYLLMIIAFSLGYLFIALEHPLKINKASTALLTGVVCWVLLVLGKNSLIVIPEHFIGDPVSHIQYIDLKLIEQLGEISEILFFLLGAMTIVELIDVYGGFNVITKRIKTSKRSKLLWIICITTFFFSALLDNLTTTIVMATFLRKLISEKEDLWFFGGMVVIAANAGGAWSPIGDVTTIMLWVGGQITASNIVINIFIPSVVCLLVPLIILSFRTNDDIQLRITQEKGSQDHESTSIFATRLIFVLGICGLLFVPLFKYLTHLPPFMGMLFSLSILWLTTEILFYNKEISKDNENLKVATIITRIDTPSILFFLGILLAVGSLQTAGHLEDLALVFDNHLGDIYLINTAIGLLSAIVDNVPLVAGAIGMYPLTSYPQDHKFWELLAYCAGTGGSSLIIGSAAGVAIMGILKIEFVWFLKKISWLAIIGYFAGIITYYLIFQ